ncbi:MAG: sulfatase-like hydrolase/transferase [Verrucomicrobiae bacterium]|nr:sulfatase-like hydrolase/transferase [Verrucomicrobiae bacterium]
MAAMNALFRLLAVAACILVTIGFDRARAASDKPNFILVMADDQGWGDMAYYGHPDLKTPNFDAMAASPSAIRFDRFYAAAPVCSPTRGSVMTGRHPNRFGCFKWGNTLRPQEITIAEALKTAGYTTGHFGKWHLGSVQKTSPVNPGASGFDRWVSAPNFFDNDPILSEAGVAKQFAGESSFVTVDAALGFVRDCAKAGKPFLAVVWFGSPHGPHAATEEFAKLYADKPKADMNYLGEVTGMDAAFGKLRDALGELNIRDNTLLWYNSDNGALPKVGSAGPFRGLKGQVYEGGLLVPAIVEWPARIDKNRVVASRANTEDIYPTLLQIAGVTMENQPPLDGVSLLPVIDGKTDGPRARPMGFWDYASPGFGTPSAQWMAELLEAQKNGDEIGNRERLFSDAAEIRPPADLDERPGHAAWIDGDWKLHRIAAGAGKKKKGAPADAAAPPEKVTWELYNLAEDPSETNDLADAEPDRVKTMRAALEAWMRSVAGSLRGEDYR